MADHDLLAELAGYRNELAYAEVQGRGDPAAIREEINRVSGDIKTEAERLASEAGKLRKAGQDAAADELAARGRQMLDALPADAEDAKQRAPRERATRKKPEAS